MLFACMYSKMRGRGRGGYRGRGSGRGGSWRGRQWRGVGHFHDFDVDYPPCHDEVAVGSTPGIGPVTQSANVSAAVDAEKDELKISTQVSIIVRQ